MGKKKNSNKRVDELGNLVNAYADLAEACGSISKSIDNQLGKARVLEHNDNMKGSLAARTLCNDIIDAYNEMQGVNLYHIYGGAFRSCDNRDRNKYMEILQKDLLKMVIIKYACGVNLGGMSIEDIIEGIMLFFEELRR